MLIQKFLYQFSVDEILDNISENVVVNVGPLESVTVHTPNQMVVGPGQTATRLFRVWLTSQDVIVGIPLNS